MWPWCAKIAQAELAPRATSDEAAGLFPRDAFALLGEAGLLGLPYPKYGGAGQPYEVYLQALEEVASAWMTVGVGVSVHVMASYAMAAFGTPEQRASYLPEMVSGRMLGAYALSEAQAGSDISAMTTRAKRADHGYELNGAKAWTTHGSYADFYTTFARTGDDPRGGVSCFYVPGHAPGLTFGSPERKMGLNGSPTTALYFDAVSIGDRQRIGDEGQGAGLPCPPWIPGGWELPRVRPDWHRPRWTWQRTMRSSVSSLGIPLRSFRGFASCWRRWRQRLILRVRHISWRPESGTPADVQPRCCGGEVDRIRCGHEGDNRRSPGARWLWLYPGLPGRALYARGQVTQIFEGTNQIQRLVIAANSSSNLPTGVGRGEWGMRLGQSDVVLVTGGASGLGAATVRAMVAEGASALIVDLPSSSGSELAAELGARAVRSGRRTR